MEKIQCEPPVANGNYGCFVHFSDGLVVRVIVRATDIVVGMGPGQIATETPPPATPLCFYDYHCPDGLLVLTKRECKSAKSSRPHPPGAPVGPPAVAQRKAASQTPQSAGSLSSVQHVLASPGRPLDASTRDFFAARFGHDFGDVRVHDDAAAAASARGVQALAYTVGTDLVFGAGQYSPGTSAGRHLLAHELTHVIQQRGRPAATIQRHKDDLVGYTGGQSGRVIVLNAGMPSYVAPAVSGHPGHGENEPSVGPIPTGSYAIQPGVTRAAVSSSQAGSAERLGSEADIRKLPAPIRVPVRAPTIAMCPARRRITRRNNVTHRRTVGDRSGSRFRGRRRSSHRKACERNATGFICTVEIRTTPSAAAA
ncbi:MAG: DUF4157 domain-containing protein [Nitrospira sp.]